MEINKIYNGEAVKTMEWFPDNFIDLVVTSPPYDNLRDYKGFDFNFEEMVIHLFRVIKEGGVVVWVVGDAVVNGSETGSSFRQALFFMECGFKLHDTMIYQKTGGGFPQKTRYTPSFEYMFILVKGKIKTANLIKDHENRWTHRWSPKSSIRQKDGSLKERKNRNTKLNKFGTRFNIWRITNGYGYGHSDEELARKHPATFPEKLAEDHIKSWSNEGDLVLDPMCGSGTTCKMAKLNNRNYIGIDISEEYCKISKERCSPTTVSTTGEEK